MMTIVRVLVVALLGTVLGGSSCNTEGNDGGSSHALRDAGDLGPQGGQCQVQCTTASDCCSGSQCNTSVFHFNCTNGLCSQVGCTGDGDCSDLPGSKCAVLGTFGACGVGCQLPEDCCPPLPPGVVMPAGQNRVTVALDGGGQATFYRCGTYPQKFICTGNDITPDDAGTAGVCVRVCTEDADCPGIVFPIPDAGFFSIRVDGGMVTIPTDAGVFRFFQQHCQPQFPGAPFGACEKGCVEDVDCCVDPTGVSCQGFGLRHVCVAGTCVKDGCRSDAECSAGLCQPH